MPSGPAALSGRCLSACARCGDRCRAGCLKKLAASGKGTGPLGHWVSCVSDLPQFTPVLHSLWHSFLDFQLPVCAARQAQMLSGIGSHISGL